MVVAVFVENGGHGSTVAAPLAKALFEERFGKKPAPADKPGVIRAANPSERP
jgi:cell division protein FtsI/penicillin-binding protein 2